MLYVLATYLIMLGMKIQDPKEYPVLCVLAAPLTCPLIVGMILADLSKTKQP